MVPRHRRRSRNSSAKTKFFKSPRRTLSEYPCGGLARTLCSAFRRRKFRQSAADPIGSAAEQICSAAVRRVRGGIFCSAAKLNLADSAGVRRGPARTQADPGGVRGGIVPPWELPSQGLGLGLGLRLGLWLGSGLGLGLGLLTLTLIITLTLDLVE